MVASVSIISNAKKLAGLQRLARLDFAEALSTAPGEALNILLGLPSLAIWIRRVAMESYRISE